MYSRGPDYDQWVITVYSIEEGVAIQCTVLRRGLQYSVQY